MTRADFTTCGRNIFPAPNRSPTTFMPSMSGPSITSIGRAYLRRASSVSAMPCAEMPLTRAWESRSSTLPERQASSLARSRAQLRVGLLVDAELARVDDAHGQPRPDRVVEECGVHRFAHGIVAAERER